MTFWRPDNLRACLGPGAAWVSRGETPEIELAGLSIDSRSIRPGEAFLALPGERFDGHDFIPAALNAGARMLIVERPEPASPERIGADIPVVRVPDARKALARLARAYRDALPGVRVIAVAGSNGKTTTVRLIDAVLSSRLRGVASPKSFNNDIGVPLTILRARPGDQYLLCEVGMNAPGEMANLASLIGPDIAVITAIQREHLEFLGGLEGVARENGSLLTFLRAGGMAVVPSGQPLLADFLKSIGSVVTFGADDEADLRITAALHERDEAGGVGVRVTLNDRWTYDVPLAGLHNATNAAAAVAVGRRFGLDDDSIRLGLARAKAPEMRMQRRVIGGIEVFNDAYNSNPDSAIAAVRAFAEIARTAARRVIILGDMLELGEHALPGHEEVADAILASRAADMVILVGPLAGASAQRLRAGMAPDRVTAVPHAAPTGGAAAIASMLRPGDTVLLKGSRGVGLERVEAALAEALDSSASPALAEPKHPLPPSLFPSPPAGR